VVQQVLGGGKRADMRPGAEAASRPVPASSDPGIAGPFQMVFSHDEVGDGAAGTPVQRGCTVLSIRI